MILVSGILFVFVICMYSLLLIFNAYQNLLLWLLLKNISKECSLVLPIDFFSMLTWAWI